MPRRLVGSLAVLALAFTCAPSALAQITAATLSGTIKDETGGPLPGADIVAKNLDTGTSRSAVSNGNGAFTLFDGNGNVIPSASQLAAPTQTSERQIQLAAKLSW